MVLVGLGWKAGVQGRGLPCGWDPCGGFLLFGGLVGCFFWVVMLGQLVVFS